VSRVKVRVLGKLRFSEEDGLQFLVSLNRQSEIPTSPLWSLVITHEAEASRGPLVNPSELTVGDFVLYAYHGVARYRGVYRTPFTQKESVILECGEDSTYHVPPDSYDFIHKFTGDLPKLPRLGEKPNLRSSSSDILRKRVRKPLTSKVAS
jgi:transcription-repair coupling factor (superfamily II helicase)